ncbi:uncharacterized protein LOC122537440 [Frieseomelitta varia]|uniref:uncharacterized protein LOC122537440 n=1 Tax=Frieseomelitta varia TaxID=561572 RepID=UPI001CB6A32D|nr:uncharacterized protein LOC122537440 [Frieseomelitta varia]
MHNVGNVAESERKRRRRRSDVEICIKMTRGCFDEKYMSGLFGAPRGGTSLSRCWRHMTLNENKPTDRDRSDYVLWDYPLEDKFTKMYFAMKDAGFVPSVEHAVKVAAQCKPHLRIRSYCGSLSP